MNYRYEEDFTANRDFKMTIGNNFNLCELEPRSTGKSHIYKENSPNSILVSGGQTTVANLFYNMS